MQAVRQSVCRDRLITLILSLQANDIDPETKRYRPVEADATKRIHYERVIGYSLDIDFNLTPDATISDFNNVQPVPCPACEFVEYVAYLSLDDPTKGYAHKNFATSCRQCNLELTREVLAVGRFALTLLLYMRAKVYLNGTKCVLGSCSFSAR